jgi:ADP-ribose pyrophosphatase YjhB (NUDIX family)
MQAEIAILARRYGRPRALAHTLPTFRFSPLNRRREGEVAMAIRRRNGLYLLQTKDSYPESTFRLPTGGIMRGETIEHALLRETREETSLDVEISRFAAVLTYRSPGSRQAFASYLFILEEQGGELQAIDESEGITGWLEADVSALEDAAERLRSCTGPWRKWGEFRALVIDALKDALARRN